MNAAIRAVVRKAISNGVKVKGIKKGYQGLLNEEIIDLDRTSVSDTIQRGGTILGTARCSEFKYEEGQAQGAEMCKKHGIDGVVVIGGDGSYRGAQALARHGINTIGVPGTIDLDIACTDYTIGFDTALRTIVEAVDKLRDTSSSHHRCSVVEVMGNRCGDLAIWSGIACGAEIVCTSETGFEETEILERLRDLDVIRKKRHAIVIISEKMTDVHQFARKISLSTGFSGRATVLGHVQRGGSPTPTDRVLASRMGEKAVDLLMQGIGGQCVGIKDNKMIATPIEEALNLPRGSRKQLQNLFERLV